MSSRTRRDACRLLLLALAISGCEVSGRLETGPSPATMPSPVTCEWHGWQLVAPYEANVDCQTLTMPWGTWCRNLGEGHYSAWLFASPSGVAMFRHGLERP